jgi:hypothetical protein
MSPIHDAAFSPAGKIKLKPNAYEYRSGNIHLSKSFRDKDGAVITGPRNFTTSPTRKGPTTTPGRLFKETISHMEDPYDT